MGLRAKLMLTFIVITLCLIGFTQYFALTRTSAFQTERISAELRLVERRFNQKFEDERAFNEKLISTITSEQKYRSFLQQIRDNFYIFAEEIALDTGAGIVFITDENLNVRGINTALENIDTDKYIALVETLAESPQISDILEEVLDNGHTISKVIVQNDMLLNTTNVPLKESLADDYALGVVTAAGVINDEWVLEFLSDKTADIDVIYYAGDTAVASNVSLERRNILLKAAAVATEASENFYLINGERFIMERGTFENTELPAGYFFASSFDVAMEPFLVLQKTIILIGLTSLVIGLLVVWLLTNRIVFPVRLLVRGTQEIAAGNYDYKVDNDSKDEVGELSRAFNTMAEGLRDKDRIKNLFGRYVPEAVVEGLISDRGALAPLEREATVLFADLAGFTQMTELSGPAGIIDILNAYFDDATKLISEQSGVVTQFQGDAVMAIFNVPLEDPEHVSHAMRAALAIQRCVAQKTYSGKALKVRIGINTGMLIAGNVGGGGRQCYTVHGDTVNLAARLEAMNKQLGTEILISEASAKHLPDFELRSQGMTEVRGLSGKIEIFSPV
jgi:class 3 adenylate cyclase/predicted regulator of amino acid metabolism with ACT domain